jgi:hypothetical protein
MGRAKTREEKLFGAAVLKLTFRLRGDEPSETFQALYQGVLEDLGLQDVDVDRYLDAHLEAVMASVDKVRK